MLVELFVFGTFWFWLLLAALVGLEILFDCIENGKGSTIVAILGLAILQCFSALNPLGWIGNHPAEVIGGVFGYVVFGSAVWGRMKWRFKVRQAFEDACHKVEDWLQDKGVTSSGNGGVPKVPAELEAEFVKWTQCCFRRDVRDPIRIKDNKMWFIRISTCWVFNLIWTCTHDAVYRAFSTMYYALARTLQADSDRMFRSLKD